MSLIEVNNLTFSYDSSAENIFEDVSFKIDSNWKLGFVGRNGRGKTTFLKLLCNEYEYSGSIKSSVNFEYFPYQVKNKACTVLDVIETINPDYELWKISIELQNLNIDENILDCVYDNLSNGEQVKVLLAIMFSKDNNFLLIDEPTNHLDGLARREVADYLKSKKGFILVSHDRYFLDNVVDYIMAINKASIDIEKGNFCSWYNNKERKDNYEIKKNEKLKKEIVQLEASSKRVNDWAQAAEKSKFGGSLTDRGYAGHKAAKLQKRSKAVETRKNKTIEEKSNLMKDVETAIDLKMFPLKHHKKTLVNIEDLSISYGSKHVFENFNLTIQQGEKILIKGSNGCGKSSILKAIVGETEYKGTIKKAENIKISYIMQDVSELKGRIDSLAQEKGIDITLLNTILRQLGFERYHLEKKIEELSEGQKKKMMLAVSLCEPAHLYIWDEPLNYLDIFSRIQLENLIKNHDMTLIMVEHDDSFNRSLDFKVLDL